MCGTRTEPFRSRSALSGGRYRGTPSCIEGLVSERLKGLLSAPMSVINVFTAG